MKFNNTEEQIEFLKMCAASYEYGNQPQISDKEYDDLYDDAKLKLPDHPFFNTVGGAISHEYGKVVKHKVPMGSLTKNRNIGEFHEWLKKGFNDYTDKFKQDNYGFIFQPKLDGLAVSLVYVYGRLLTAVTRGDGSEGIDITANAEYISGIPQKISFTSRPIEIRGEIFKERKDFYENWAGKYANPRNFASGAAMQKDPLITKERGLSFVAYNCLGLDFNTETLRNHFIKSQGFSNLVDITGVCSDADMGAIADYGKKYMDSLDRDKLPYDIDGVVVKLNDCIDSFALGMVGSSLKPHAQTAIKYPTEQKETKLLDKEYNVGRQGQITPVGILEPVQLAGTTVSRVSLHNLLFIANNKLYTGCTILLEKSGDIIPHVVRRIIKDKEDVTMEPFPDYCPVCNSKLTWDDTYTTKWCNNALCNARIAGNIEHWFKTLNIKGIGPGIISKFLVEKDINSLSDIYKAADKYVDRIDNMDMPKSDSMCARLEHSIGLNNYFKICKIIMKSKNREMFLHEFIRALGIANIGRMSKQLIEKTGCETLDDVFTLNTREIMSLDGFGGIKANTFVTELHNMEDEIILLEDFITIKEKDTTGKLSDKSFCFTGKFSNPTRKEMEKLVIQFGGDLTGVKKGMTALVWDGDMKGNKYNKAVKFNIPIIQQSEFMKMIK